MPAAALLLEALLPGDSSVRLGVARLEGSMG
jgi:hypothetical protein